MILFLSSPLNRNETLLCLHHLEVQEVADLLLVLMFIDVVSHALSFYFCVSFLHFVFSVKEEDV